MIDKYVQHTKGYHKKLRVVDAFKVERRGELSTYNPDNLGNRKLLWHGSRFSNFVGILSQGLRIAPPEAPSTGYAFGKGVYFADMIEKSFHYACPNLSNGVGIYVLGEVALGNPNECYDCNSSLSAKTLPKGTNSTHAIGNNYPDPSKDTVLTDGSRVPLGPIINNKKAWIGSNEYIVYNTN